MRVLYVSESRIPSLGANGFQVMKMCEALANLGTEVELLVPRTDASTEPAVGDALWEHYGISRPFPVRWIDATGPGLYGYGVRAARHARERRADLLYGRHLAGLTLASRTGATTLAELHQVPRGRLAPHVFRRLLARRNLRGLVVISRALAELVREAVGPRLAGRPIHVAPDGVDPERYRNLPAPADARAALGLDPDRFTLGYAGHLYPGRGIETIAALARRLPDVSFRIVGGHADDVARWRQDARVRECENLHLVGFVPNRVLPDQLAACEALLMPYGEQVQVAGGGDTSRWMSPLKMFEFMATGRLVISSDLPVLREVLDERNAALCPPADVGVWLAAVERARADRVWRDALGERARADVARFSWEERARGILALASAP